MLPLAHIPGNAIVEKRLRGDHEGLETNKALLNGNRLPRR